MAKYKARHLCKGHRWSEYASWYQVNVGFWRGYRCLRCSELKSTLEAIPVLIGAKTREATW